MNKVQPREFRLKLKNRIRTPPVPSFAPNQSHNGDWPGLVTPYDAGLMSARVVVPYGPPICSLLFSPLTSTEMLTNFVTRIYRIFTGRESMA